MESDELILVSHKGVCNIKQPPHHSCFLQQNSASVVFLSFHSSLKLFLDRFVLGCFLGVHFVLPSGIMADQRSELSGMVTSSERPREIADVQELEMSLADTTPHDTLEFEAKKNLLNYWKAYFCGQYRHDYERLYIALQRSGQLRDLLAIEPFMRGNRWPLQPRESDLVGDFINDAKEAKDILDGLVDIINREQPGLAIKEADVKSVTRAVSKAEQDPDGLRAISDFARTSIIGATPEAVKKVHDWFRGAHHRQVILLISVTHVVRTPCTWHP